MGKKAILLILILLVTTFFIGDTNYAGNDKGDPVATITEIFAPVTLNGTPLLRANQYIYGSDIIKTGSTGKVRFMFPDETEITVKPKSEVQINDVNISLGDRNKQNSLLVIAGDIWCKATEGTDTNVNTMTAAAGIRGTEFSVSVADDGSSNVMVVNGKVNVVSGEESTDVSSSQKATVNSENFEEVSVSQADTKYDDIRVKDPKSGKITTIRRYREDKKFRDKKEEELEKDPGKKANALFKIATQLSDDTKEVSKDVKKQRQETSKKEEMDAKTVREIKQVDKEVNYTKNRATALKYISDNMKDKYGDVKEVKEKTGFVEKKLTEIDKMIADMDAFIEEWDAEIDAMINEMEGKIDDMEKDFGFDDDDFDF